MARLIVAPRARVDVREIVNYLEEHAGKAVALRYALEFDAAIDRIAEFPGLGSPRPEFGSEMRVVVVKPYLVFYEYGGGASVHVLRVLDGRRNITGDVLQSGARRS